MATRPCYRPLEKYIGVKTMDSPQFAWNGGFAFSQKQKNVVALHEAIQLADPSARVLEISSKSLQPLGVSLSAFNLRLKINGEDCSVESVFQASKVFEDGVGPFHEKYTLDSHEVRHFVQDASAGKRLLAFDWNGEKWALVPRTAFFFRLYVEALQQNSELAKQLMEYDGFTDIEFNPKKQINCQAAAAAFYVSLMRSGRGVEILSNREEFIKTVAAQSSFEVDSRWHDAAAVTNVKAASMSPRISAAYERPASTVRTSCPEGYVNALEFADAAGTIESWKCSENAGIVKLWIPQEVKSIGNFAFKGCANLEEVVCEECGGGPALSLGLMSFAGCGKMRSVRLPQRINSLGKGAFRDNPALTEFFVPVEHYAITCGDHLFDNCPDGDRKMEQLH